MTRSRFSRRALLASSAATLVAGPAAAIGEGSRVGIGQLKHGGDWDHRPEALRRILWETARRTSIQVARDATPVSATDDELFTHPLLVLTGSQGMGLDEAARARLARHLRFGGLLWIDAPSPDAPFVASAERLVSQLLPRSELKELGPDHVMFKSFFLLDKVAGRTEEDTRLFGASIMDRTAVLFTRCDVLGALERDRFGTWMFECEPGGSRQREMAMRFAVNVMMYATCLDYKTDQVHIPFIMKKRRR